MALPEREGLFYRHDGSAGGLIQGHELVDNNEIVPPQGVLSEYLAGEFFREYFDDASPDYYKNIPQHVNDLLIGLDVNGDRISGSIPKCMVMGVPEFFWQYGRHFSSLIPASVDGSASGKDTVKGRLVSGLAGDAAADMDINTIIPLDTYFKNLITYYNLPPDYVEGQKQLMTTADGKSYGAYTLKFIHPADSQIVIEVYAGPVPTNLDINTINIAFYDAMNHRRIFRIDMSSLPMTGPAMEEEKRSGGKTSRKQEECYATLRIKEGRVHYEMTQDAVDVMKEPDEILSESEDPSDVLEIFLRSLRMNLLHEVDVNHDFEAFLPEYTSESLFDQQVRIRRIVQRGERIAPHVLGMLQKELLLCLTIDPFITIHALRDSGIAMLIPGLAHVTRDQWQRVLQSKHLVVAPIPSNLKQRTAAFIEDQRLAYRSHRHAEDSFNGLEMFIRALRDAGVVAREGNEWDLYERLWEDPTQYDVQLASLDKPVEIPIDSDDFDLAVLAGVRSNEGSYYILGPSSNLISTQAIQRIIVGNVIDSLRVAIKHEPEDIGQRAIRAMMHIQRYAEDTEIQAVFDALNEEETPRHKSSLEESTAKLKLQERLGGIILTYVLLEEFPGITARHLKDLYEATAIADFPKSPDFGNIFLDLKLLGLVYADRLHRITLKQDAVSVVFYSLRSEGTLTKLGKLKHDTKFLSCFRESLEGSDDRNLWGKDWPQVKSFLSRMINTMSRRQGKIDSIEALQSLIERDYELLEYRIRQEARIFRRNATLLLNAYKRYLEHPEMQ